MSVAMRVVDDSVAAIARTVLYEGYVLWPYRRSALKNQQRWTFGGVYPAAYSRSGHDDDRSLMRTECLLVPEDGCTLSITVRFLQIVERNVASIDGNGTPLFKDLVEVDDTRYAAWDEAVEREVTLADIPLTGVAKEARSADVAIAGGASEEAVYASNGRRAGLIVRRWKTLRGSISASTAPTDAGVLRVRVDIVNDSEWFGEPRSEVLRRTFVSTHTILRVAGGRFISSIDPPPDCATAAETCRNIGTWPVLAGVASEADTMLSSPIILYDYPQVAPESSGDFFDAAEIDQLLVLGVMSMTEAEQQAMAECDPRVREILERCRAMSADDLLRLHGVTRELRSLETPP